MLKWILFASQMLALKKNFTKSASAFNYVEHTIERARGYFLFSIGCVVSGLFLMVALVVAVIGIGLQTEQHGTISFSGLMISATILLGMSAVFFLLSLLVLILQKQKILEKKKAQDEEHKFHNPIQPWLEEVLKQVLANLTKPKSQSKSSANSHFNSQSKAHSEAQDNLKERPVNDPIK